MCVCGECGELGVWWVCGGYGEVVTLGVLHTVSHCMASRTVHLPGTSGSRGR